MKRLVHPNVEVRRGAHGLGLFATGPVRQGETVAEYWGPAVSDAVMRRSRGRYFFELDSGMAIDGKGRSNMGRYVNHSCRPNCEPVEEDGRIFIRAKRAIRPGEEFGYDYGRAYWEAYIQPIGCRCGCGGKGPRRWR
jgi:SET domain-containing protein